MFERHTQVTEARTPINNATAILVVAGDLSEDVLPEVGSVRAFYLDGTYGIMFRKGVWHGLDCFPVHSVSVEYLFLSDAATEDEIEASREPIQGERTELFDFSDQNIAFQITDPQGVITF